MCASRPEPQQNLHEAIERAFVEISSAEIGAVAARCGGRVAEHGRVVALSVVDRPVVLDVRDRTVRDAAGAQVAEFVAAPIVRYVALCGGFEPTGELVGFGDVVDARSYLGPFRGRVIAPFVGLFGSDPAGFEHAASVLGCERADAARQVGATAFAVRVFPRVVLVFVLHAGDDELPGEAQVLFDRAAFAAFAVDDVVAFADLASRALRGKLALPR